MNKLRNIIIALAVVFGVVSCDQFDLDRQDDPNQAGLDAASVDFYFNNIQVDMGSFSVNLANRTMPATRMTAMTGGNIYDNAWSPTTFNGTWFTAYSGILQDMNAMLPLAEEQGLTTHTGATKIMKAYVLMSLVDLFGNVPYTEALQGLPVPSPNADTDESVYSAALALLNEALADLSIAASAAPTNDLFYDGDADQWIKVANSMKMKYYLNVGGAGAEIAAIVADGNFIDSGADDFQFSYGSERSDPGSRHPWYYEHYESNGGRYLSNYYMWSMREDKTAIDPRIRFYVYRQDLDPRDENQFTLGCIDFGNPDAVGDEVIITKPVHYTANDCFCLATTSADPADANGYWGREHGDNDGIPPDGEKKTSFGLYPAGGLFDASQGSHVKNGGADGATGAGVAPMMLNSYVKFMRAEAALTSGTGEDARALLLEGMNASIGKVFGFYNNAAGQPGFTAGESAAWGTDAAGVAAYTNEVLARYDAAADDDARLDIVMREYWLASWGNGIEAYNGYRRTGFPTALQPTREAVSGEFPRSFWYPADYVALNANATQKASQSTQVFWDTNPAGFIK